MTEPWTVEGAKVEELFRSVASTLQEHNPHIWFNIDRYGTEHFPLRAVAAFNRTGVAGDEDLVISIDVQQSPRRFRFSCDVARGDGFVLIEGPNDELARPVGEKDLRAWTGAWFVQARSFVEAQTDYFIEELS